MENFSEESFKAYYNHKRFPSPWQAMVGCAVMQFVVIVPLIVFTMVAGGNLSSLFRTSFGEYMFNGILSQFFAVLIIPLFFLLVTKKDMRSTLRLKKNIDAVQIILLILVSLGAFFAVQLVNASFLEFLISFMGEPSDISPMADATNVSQLLFELVIIAGLPAICEEIFFRGFVMRSFERYSPVLAVIISSVAFAIMHGNLQQILYAFILGLILGTVVMVTDSLLAGTLMHFTLNATSVILSYPPVYELYENFASNYLDIYLIISIALFVFIGVPAFIILIFYTRKKNIKKYSQPFVSEMESTHLLPKQEGWEKGLHIVGWLAFVGINIISMLMLWYSDILTETIG